MKSEKKRPSEKSTVFKKTYTEYLAQISSIDFSTKQERLGVKLEGREIVVPFFGKSYRFSSNSIADPSGKRPDFGTCVVLCKYLLLCTAGSPQESDWVSYRDFKEAGPLTHFFVSNVENPIAATFSGLAGDLEKACVAFGGTRPDIQLSYDLIMRFDPLPKVPLLMLFNDADDDFPANCSVLFESRAEKYLDAESLAILGGIFTDRLKRAVDSA